MCVARHKTDLCLIKSVCPLLKHGLSRVEPMHQREHWRPQSHLFFGPRSAGRRSGKTNRFSSVVVSFQQSGFIRPRSALALPEIQLLSTRAVRLEREEASTPMEFAAASSDRYRSRSQQSPTQTSCSLRVPDAPSSVESLKSRVLCEERFKPTCNRSV